MQLKYRTYGNPTRIVVVKVRVSKLKFMIIRMKMWHAYQVYSRIVIKLRNAIKRVEKVTTVTFSLTKNNVIEELDPP